MVVFMVFIGQCGVFVGGYVFDLFCYFMYVVVVQIVVDVGICVQQFNEIEDFVGVYCVGFFYIVLVGIYFNWVFIWIVDVVVLVVFVSKVVVGLVYQWYFYCF